MLDETDMMLEFGFKREIENIISSIKEEKTMLNADQNLQYLLFSATVPSWVTNIAQEIMKPDFLLVDMIQKNENKTSMSVKHLSVYFPNMRLKLLGIKAIIKKYKTDKNFKCIVFTNTKQMASFIASQDIGVKKC